MMIILKDQMENCKSTICIASKINNNHDIYIQEVATKMKTTLEDFVVSHSLMENQKPVHQTTVVNANYGHAPTMMMTTTTKIK